MGATKKAQMAEADRDQKVCGHCRRTKRRRCQTCGEKTCGDCEGNRCTYCTETLTKAED